MENKIERIFFKKVFFIIIGFFVFATGGLFIGASQVDALTISPLLLEVNVNSGSSDKQIIKLFNETDEELYISAYIQTFQPKGEEGDVELLVPRLDYQALNWIKLPLNSFPIGPKQIVDVPVITIVPKTAQVGGYYLAVMFETVSNPGVSEANVGISSSLGSLMLLRVNGQADESMNIVDFELINKQKVFNYVQIDFFTRLENSGNVHVKPKGQILIKNIFGGLSEVIEFNTNKRNVLPRSTRTFQDYWGDEDFPHQTEGFIKGLIAELNHFALGRYTAQLNLDYGDGHQRVSSEKICFWVFPWRTVMIVSILLVIFIIFIIINSIIQRESLQKVSLSKPLSVKSVKKTIKKNAQVKKMAIEFEIKKPVKKITQKKTPSKQVVVRKKTKKKTPIKSKNKI